MARAQKFVVLGLAGLALWLGCQGGEGTPAADAGGGAGGRDNGAASGGSQSSPSSGGGGGGPSASSGSGAASGGASGTGGALADAGEDDAGGGTAEAGVSGTGGTSVVDAAALPDNAPATGDKPHALLVWGYGEHSPTPKASDPPKAFDLTMKSRLEAKGLVVDLAVDASSSLAQINGKALLVISSSVNRTNLFDAGKPRFKDVAIPTIVMKDGTIEVMGLGVGGAGGFSTDVGQSQLTIVAPGDALAAGLSGNVTVYTKGDRLIFAAPTPAAKKIATIVGHADQVGIFAYAKGAMMVGMTAPAKRMGFFIHRNTNYSPDGIKLFDAAVDYLLAP